MNTHRALPPLFRPALIKFAWRWEVIFYSCNSPVVDVLMNGERRAFPLPAGGPFGRPSEGMGRWIFTWNNKEPFAFSRWKYTPWMALVAYNYVAGTLVSSFLYLFLSGGNVVLSMFLYPSEKGFIRGISSSLEFTDDNIFQEKSDLKGKFCSGREYLGTRNKVRINGYTHTPDNNSRTRAIWRGPTQWGDGWGAIAKSGVKFVNLSAINLN